MQIRLAGRRASIPRMATAPLSKSKWTGDCWELDETGEPPATKLRTAQTRRPGRHSFRGATDDSSLLRQQARHEILSALNRDETAAVSAIPRTQLTSYGRILFKASSITLFGRIPCGQNRTPSFGEVDFAALGACRITKLDSIRARTTTGTGIPTCRWNSPPRTAY